MHAHQSSPTARPEAPAAASALRGSPPPGTAPDCSRMPTPLPPPPPPRASPMRTPPGFMALTSPTTAFLLSVMWQASHTFSILEPVTPSGRRSHSTCRGGGGGWGEGVRGEG